MYTTCLFCNHDLDRNETFETFPIGKRLAFDPAKGRLWVVCRRCERWNLTPLEERWEAIETAERLYRDTRRRVSTDEIGLAKLPDGTTLIRIGLPLRPEFAAWRYGDQFGRRRNRQLAIVGGGVAAIGILAVGGMVAGVSVAAFTGVLTQSLQRVVHGSPEAIVATIRTAAGDTLPVRRRHLAETVLSRADDGSLKLDLRFKNGHREFTGAEAARIAAIVVPKVNKFGGSKAVVASAVNEIEAMGSAEAFVDRVATTGHVYTRSKPRESRRWYNRAAARDYTKFGLFGLPAPQRLALEMALHEESERRALDGELGELERAWREAEEIAGISDELLISPGVQTSIDQIRDTMKDPPRG
jgi:hypothetical protein